jgi:hypothetical protein
VITIRIGLGETVTLVPNRLRAVSFSLCVISHSQATFVRKCQILDQDHGLHLVDEKSDQGAALLEEKRMVTGKSGVVAVSNGRRGGGTTMSLVMMTGG